MICILCALCPSAVKKPRQRTPEGGLALRSGYPSRFSNFSNRSTIFSKFRKWM